MAILLFRVVENAMITAASLCILGVTPNLRNRALQMCVPWVPPAMRAIVETTRAPTTIAAPPTQTQQIRDARCEHYANGSTTIRYSGNQYGKFSKCLLCDKRWRLNQAGSWVVSSGQPSASSGPSSTAATPAQPTARLRAAAAAAAAAAESAVASVAASAAAATLPTRGTHTRASRPRPPSPSQMSWQGPLDEDTLRQHQARQEEIDDIDQAWEYA